jgi:hypothetical protein
MPAWTRQDFSAKSQPRANALCACFTYVVPMNKEQCLARKPDRPAAQVAGRLFVRPNVEKQLWNVIKPKARNEADI